MFDDDDWPLGGGNPVPPPPLTAFSFPAPTTPDFPDSDVYWLGFRWATSQAGFIRGVQWYAPTTLPGVQCYIGTWAVGIPAPLAWGPITPTLGQLATYLHPAPIAIPGGVQVYVSAVLTDTYTFTPAYPWPASAGPMSTEAANVCRFVVTPPDTPNMPNSNSPLNYHVSPVCQF